jgi:Tfp pilus assembly protein PilX
MRVRQSDLRPRARSRRTRGGRLPTADRNERGAILVSVMAIVAAVLLIGIALFILGTSESDVVEYGADGAMAFGLAEGGVERARSFLKELSLADSTIDPVGTSFDEQLLGDGTYTTTITDELTGGEWVRVFEVESIGWKDGVPRQVRVTLQEETFAQYQWFINQGGWRWFRTGERFEGPVHTNRKLQIDGDPWFGGKVTASLGLTMTQGSNPTFEAGYELFVDKIDLPSFADVTSVMMPAAQDAGIYAPPLSGKLSRYEIELGRIGAGTLSYRAYEQHGGSYPPSPWVDVDVASLNGAAWFAEDVWIKGELDGELTIAVEGDITIRGDVLYEGSSPGTGPDPDCDDMLGLIAKNDIYVAKTPDNMNDVEIHAAMMALWKNFEVEDYMHGPPRGSLIIYGGIMVEQSLHIGQYQHEVVVSGYARDYRWDERLNTWWPPFFPKTGSYFVRTWQEIIPPEV